MADILVMSASKAAMTLTSQVIYGIDAQWADFGAIQNRFLSTNRNLSEISENILSATMRIRDTDSAVETAKLTRYQLIQGVSITVLWQAN